MSVISATVILTCCIVIGQLPTSVRSTEQPASEERINKRYFLDKLLMEYGDGEHLTVDEVQRLLATLKKCEKDNTTREKEQFRRSTASSDGNEMANVSGTCGMRDDWMDDPHCLDNMVSENKMRYSGEVFKLQMNEISVPVFSDKTKSLFIIHICLRRLCLNLLYQL